MNSIAVILISTGERYSRYIAPLIASIRQFFPPCDILLFTDSEESFDAIKIHQPDLEWPKATMLRYHAILAQQELLLKYEHVFLMDTDMQVVRKIESSEICSVGLTAVLHPGFPTTFERRKESRAYIEGNPPYYQGCFIGGKTQAFLEMCSTISSNIDTDSTNDITAVWHDESHLNWYLSQHPPTTTLSPPWAWPDPPTFDEHGNDSYFSKMQKRYGTRKEEFVPAILHRQKSLKILIAVESCFRDLQNGSHQVIRETWGKDLDSSVDLRFFIGGAERLLLQEDEIQLDVKDDYDNLPYKTKEIFRWGWTKGYDFIFKCDVDSFLVPSKLLSCNFKSYDYVGFFTSNSEIPYLYASGGHGYFLSRRAAEVIASSAPDLTKRHLQNEDLWVGYTLGSKIQEGLLTKFQPPNFKDYASWHMNRNREGSKVNHEWLREKYVEHSLDTNKIVQGIWVGSELTNIQKLCIRSYQDHGHEFHLYTNGPVQGIPEGTVIRSISEIMVPSNRDRFTCESHFSDYFRVALIQKCGGWYVDLDTVCLRKFDFPESYAFVSESTIYGTANPDAQPTLASEEIEKYLSGCIFKAPKNAPILDYILHRIDTMDTLHPKNWICLGPELFAEAISKFNLQRYVKAPCVFDAVKYSEFLIFVNDKATWKFSDKSYAIHLRTSAWKGGSSGLSPNRCYPSNSLFEQLKRKHKIDGVLGECKVSIVIPLYNKQKFVVEAVESALAQDYNDFDVIVVDDGSTDYSAAIARLYGDRIKFIEQQNAGVSAALNNGIKNSTGDFIICLDADDWIEPNYISKTILKMADPKVGFVSTDTQLEGLEHRRLISPETTLEQEMLDNRLSGCSLIRRKAYLQTPGFMLDGYQDWNMWINILKRGWIVATAHDTCQHYRIQSDSMLPKLAGKHEEMRAKLRSLHPDLYDSQKKTSVSIENPPAKNLPIENSPVKERSTPLTPSQWRAKYGRR